MAKNTDHLAGGLDTDNTGGVLSGLLAEEDDLDRRALWRIGSWGVGAVAAVILAVMANQTSLGWKRDQVAAADLTRQAQQIQQVVFNSKNNTMYVLDVAGAAVDARAPGTNDLRARIEVGGEPTAGGISTA